MTGGFGHYESFDSFEEMQAYMRRKEEEANANVHPRQQDIDWGTYWVRLAPDLGLAVFGYVNTDAEIRALGEDRETMVMLRDAHARGYRYGKAYSVLEPEGEWGSTHIANAWPITRAQFMQAKMAHWNPQPDDKWFIEILAEIQGALQSRQADAEFTVVEEDGSDG